MTTEWQRCSLTFAAQGEFAWTAVGADLAASKVDAATVWVDAVQLEKGAEASPYQPAAPFEMALSTDAPGNLFLASGVRPALALRLNAFNDGTAPLAETVTLSVSDFSDKEILRRAVPVAVPARSSVSIPVNLPVERLGFFRARIQGQGNPGATLRCAILKAQGGADTRFGVNHADPWDFLLPLAHKAGITWWRDWTTQWRTVQPQANAAFDFREPDVQIDRVVRQKGNALALLPFPSSLWASSADPAAVDKIARSDYERQRVPTGFKPKDEAAFSKYVAESVRHLRDRVKVYQVFNEALYTSYSLPASAGHTMDDYIRLLRLAYAAVKAEQPGALVVAGPGIWPSSKWAREFVEAGGLRFADILDVHLYPKGDPEPYADSLAELWKRMEERGEARPIWLTELGCYADDDPPITPMGAYFGDSAMRQALYGDEREASEWLVKFSALFFANGGERIFLHAGTCGEINGVDAGGVFFEYGGTPRKMLTAVATLTGLLPPEAKFEKTEGIAEKIVAYWFRTPNGRVAVAWSSDGEPHAVRLRAGVKMLDLMGNPVAAGTAITAAPVYLTSR